MPWQENLEDHGRLIRFYPSERIYHLEHILVDTPSIKNPCIVYDTVVYAGFSVVYCTGPSAHQLGCGSFCTAIVYNCTEVASLWNRLSLD